MPPALEAGESADGEGGSVSDGGGVDLSIGVTGGGGGGTRFGGGGGGGGARRRGVAADHTSALTRETTVSSQWLQC
jgi:hypothetical protein